MVSRASREFSVHLNWCKRRPLEGVDGGRGSGNGNDATYSASKASKKLKRRLDFGSAWKIRRTKKKRSPDIVHSTQYNVQLDQTNSKISHF